MKTYIINGVGIGGGGGRVRCPIHTIEHDSNILCPNCQLEQTQKDGYPLNGVYHKGVFSGEFKDGDELITYGPSGGGGKKVCPHYITPEGQAKCTHCNND